MKDVLSLISEMRKNPPKKDDPRFDELEAAIGMEDEALLGEGDALGEEADVLEGEEEALEDVDDDVAMMEAELGGPEELPEEEEEIDVPGKVSGGAARPKPKKRNPLMKKSSYLDM